MSAQTADQVQLDFANSFYARKLYDMAAPEYERYLGIYLNAPDRQMALFRLGESYRAIGNLNASREAYSTLLSTFTSGEFIGPASYRLADLYFQEKNFDVALPLFRRASVRVKDPAVVLSAKFYTARCLEFLRNNIEARLIYEQLVASREPTPYRDASRYSLAQIFSKTNRKADALQQLNAIVKETSNPQLRAEAAVKAGLLEIDLGKREEAAADLNKALEMPEIGPWRQVAQVGLLRVLYDAGKYKELLDAYETSPNNFPADIKPEVTLLAANSSRQLGKQDVAQRLYEQVIRENPGTTYAREAAYERLVSLYTLDDPNLIKEADAYLADDANTEKREQVILLKAESLYKRQDFAGAAPIYASLDRANLPRAFKADALFKLGWCSMQTQDTERAIKAFTDFIQMYPSDKLVPTALAQRAVAYQQSKKFPAAIKDFNELIARYPKAKERSFALQQKALTLGQQQDNAGMSAAFQLLLKEDPQSPAAAQANYWIGWSAFETKDYKNAVAPLEAARKLDKEQFFERATLRIMLSHYYLEERDPLAKEVDLYTDGGGKGKVPVEVLRWLGIQFLNDKNYESSEKYLAALTAREGEFTVDDWLNLGRSQLQGRKFAEAEKAFQTYLDAAKQPFARATGLLALGQAQLGLKEFGAAQKSADDACSLQPEGRLNAEGRTLSGDIAMAGGEYEKAAKLFLSVSVVFDDPAITPQAMEKACQAYKMAGNETDAAKILNKLQSKYPEFPLQSAKQP